MLICSEAADAASLFFEVRLASAAPQADLQAEGRANGHPSLPDGAPKNMT